MTMAFRGGVQLAVLAGLWCGVRAVQLGAETAMEDEVRDATALVQAGHVQVHEHNERLSTGAPWPQYLGDNTKCVDGGTVVADAAACQEQAIVAGHEYYQFSTTDYKCTTLSSCSSPITGTTNGWKVYRMDLWPQIHGDNTKCDGTGGFDVVDRRDCQMQAMQAGHTLYQYSTTTGNRCNHYATCAALYTPTGNNWKMYQDVTMSPTAAPTTMTLWADMGWEHTLCWNAAYTTTDQYACQADAIANGHDYYQYTPDSDGGPPKCETSATCNSPLSGRSWPWKVYYVGATFSPTASPTLAPTSGCVPVYNGDFELGTLGQMPDGFKGYFHLTGISGTTVDTEAYSGSRSMVFEGSGWQLMENGVAQEFAWSFTAGTTYTVSFWSKTENGNSGYQIRLEFLLYNEYAAGSGHQGRLLGGTSYQYYFPTGSWAEYTYTFTPTESWANTRMNFGLRDSSPDTGKVYIDKISFAGCTEAPTMSPTMAPTGAPTSLAPTMSPTYAVSANLVGDPHITSVHGSRFDVHLTGNVTLLQIPKSTEAPPLLKLTGILHNTDPNCREGTYLTMLHVDGGWVPQGRIFRPAPRRAGLRQKQRITVGPYGISIVVLHGRTESGVGYLNLRVNNLGGVKLSIGGLLGGDVPENLGKPGECA